MKGKIRVYCRLRPLCEKEIAENDREMITSIDEFTVEHPWKDDKAKQHIYDRVFDGSATQEDVFEDTRVSLKIIHYQHPFLFCKHELTFFCSCPINL